MVLGPGPGSAFDPGPNPGPLPNPGPGPAPNPGPGNPFLVAGRDSGQVRNP